MRWVQWQESHGGRREPTPASPSSDENTFACTHMHLSCANVCTHIQINVVYKKQREALTLGRVGVGGMGTALRGRVRVRGATQTAHSCCVLLSGHWLFLVSYVLCPGSRRSGPLPFCWCDSLAAPSGLWLKPTEGLGTAVTWRLMLSRTPRRCVALSCATPCCQSVSSCCWVLVTNCATVVYPIRRRAEEVTDPE